MVLEYVDETAPLTDAELADFVARSFDREPFDGKRVLFIIPDQTRSMPMAAMFRALCDALRGRAAKVDFLVALGTHPPLSEDALNALAGVSPQERASDFGDVGIFNHEWKNPDALTCIGTLTEEELADISGGRMRQRVDVTVNRRLFDYNLVCVVGPVFPHEVVGFSGGNKYFFPGVAGQDIIDAFHWLGALITNYAINGVMHTPVRDVVNRAAAMLDVEKRCFCLNVKGKHCHGIFYGSPEDAWEKAATMAMRTHIEYVDKPFKSVLAMAPAMYDELWVAGKCMYKLEPVVADGGELIIYGPHIRELSLTHGDYIREIGYHIRDYFLAQMERFQHVPGGILAHSTHVKGMGAFDNGAETPRIRVTLATGIDEETCKAIDLGYRDPAGVAADDWRGKEDEGKLLVERAGEVLYRLRESTQ